MCTSPTMFISVNVGCDEHVNLLFTASSPHPYLKNLMPINSALAGLLLRLLKLDRLVNTIFMHECE